MQPALQTTLGWSDLLSPTPPTRLLGGHGLSASITASGTGAISFEDLDLTRWRGDRLRDADGLLVYLRDLDSGAVWSAGRQPTGARPDRYEVRFEPGRVVIEREEHGIETTTTVAAAPDSPALLVRVELANRSASARRIEVTSYGEVALNKRGAHAAHPAFSRLFVQTEKMDGRAALVARRRPRSPGDAPAWLAHWMTGADDATFETDRMRFLGRGRDVDDPAAMGADLNGTTGAVLDPCVSLRRVLDLAPGDEAAVSLGIAGGRSREAVAGLAERFGEDGDVHAAILGADEHEVECRARFGFSDEEAEWAQSLASALVFRVPGLAAGPEWAAKVTTESRPPASLGVQTSRPLVVVRAASAAGLEAAQALATAIDCWSDNGMDAALIVVAETDALAEAVREALGDRATVLTDVPEADLARLAVTAAVFADDAIPEPGHDPLPDPPTPPRPEPPAEQMGRADVTQANGIGGFAPDGTAYVMHLEPDADGRPGLPPLPWTNVLANPRAGTIVSERGAVSTWATNSRTNRVSPWRTDPAPDPLSETLWLRDEDSGEVWSATPGPAPAPVAYEVRHGFGETTWRHRVAHLETEVVRFAARDLPAALTLVRLTNTSDAPRRLAVVSAARLVLGGLPDGSDRYVRTEAVGDAILATNPTGEEFADHVAVAAPVAPDGAEVSFTASREAFAGIGRSVSDPLALALGGALDGRTGAALDPVAAHRIALTVAPGETAEVAFVLGQGESRAEAHEIRDAFPDAASVRDERQRVADFWRDVTGALQIRTPEPALDRMVNGWLAVQNLACRMWGRSAYSQSGGAYGYRDQLQDSSAFMLTHPAIMREQILRHASHQFPEGDVLHWWHPPTSKGIRTRFADDLLWLPLLTSQYVDATGDASVWDEETPFVDAPVLADGEDERFLQPVRLAETASVYEHCLLAIERSLTVGANGLPLMGVGDWNDGMNRVGREGKGESVWMGMFLFDILGRFVDLVRQRGDGERADRFSAHREHLRDAINTTGWDGDWYRRATYDNGDWIGSRESDECQIDALAQGWAVLTGAAPEDRAAQALDAMEDRLVDEDAGIIRLLAPPFDTTPNDPGYIKGYVPGVRENGGQYTHAALWAVRALAEAGRCERAARLLTMLSPVTRGADPATYRAEPYVIAADVYGVAPHVGRGGWTWYTGSAGWMWRVAVESVLGMTVENGDTLVLDPCIPADWPGFSIRYRVPGDTGTEVAITVERGALAARVDGQPVGVEALPLRVPLPTDGGEHTVHLTLPTP